MMNKRYIVVEGPIGTGVTSLARKLAEHWGAVLASEEPQNNPFLARFYRQFQHHALSTQLAFLMKRDAIAHEMLHGDWLGKPIVSDFLFEKDALFARLNLDEEELTLYRQIAARIEREPRPTPDLVIYLQATPDILLNRMAVQKQDFPEGYLKRVHAAYSEFFYEYDAAPLLIVNTDHLNLVESKEDFDLLLRCISEMRGQRSYFNKSA